MFAGTNTMHECKLAAPRTGQGPNFLNFPKTFFKDLPMSDDLGIPRKFSFLNFQQLYLRFQRTSSFLIFLNQFNQSDALIPTM